MPRPLPLLAADIYTALPRGRRRGWEEAARRLLLAVARGDRSAFRRSRPQWQQVHAALQKWLQPWKGPRALAVRKELHEAIAQHPTSR
jgi:hypothetical protein